MRPKLRLNYSILDKIELTIYIFSIIFIIKQFVPATDFKYFSLAIIIVSLISLLIKDNIPRRIRFLSILTIILTQFYINVKLLLWPGWFSLLILSLVMGFISLIVLASWAFKNNLHFGKTFFSFSFTLILVLILILNFKQSLPISSIDKRDYNLIENIFSSKSDIRNYDEIVLELNNYSTMLNSSKSTILSTENIPETISQRSELLFQSLKLRALFMEDTTSFVYIAQYFEKSHSILSTSIHFGLSEEKYDSLLLLNNLIRAHYLKQ